MQSFPYQINYISETLSTQLEIKKLRKVSDSDCIICYTFQQKQGIGYDGNSWHTGLNKNIALSISVKYNNLLAVRQFDICKTIALALNDWMKKHAIITKIKWPNDILADSKKIAGILIENKIQGNNIIETTIGIGVNVNENSFPIDLPMAISMKNLTAKEYNLNTLVIELCNELYIKLLTIDKSNETTLNVQYLSHMYGLNEVLEFKKNDIIFKARVKGINEYGQLILENMDNKLIYYNFKEIEWLIYS